MVISETISGLIQGALGPLLNLIPDTNARKQAAEQFQDNVLGSLTGLVQGQLEINKQEAQHPSVWVAGWRPAVGWTCAAGVCWAFVFKPMLAFVVVAAGSDVDLPETNTGELMSLLLGMLGLGGLRTYEKRLGVARSAWAKQENEREPDNG